MKRIGFKQLALSNQNSLKRELILFDELILEKNNLEILQNIPNEFVSKKSKKELESDINFLEKKRKLKIVSFDDIEAKTLSNKPEEKLLKIQELADVRIHLKEKILNEELIYSRVNPLNERFNLLNLHQALSIRLLTSFYSITKEENFYTPLVSDIDFSIQDENFSNTETVKIVLNKLPIISSNTDWEQILDFKSDEETNKKLLALRNWITEISHKELKPIEISEKLDHLLNEYETHMQLHKLEYGIGKLETFVVTTSKLMENIVKLKLSDLVTTLFDLQKKNIKLLKAENTAPGREIAFIDSVNKNFGSM